jgi:BirA family biotin operon repressor/biotin-[acetyl-CoA-carboxylase] ligase
MSIAFSDYPNHPRPYLIGMTVAVACAAVLHCELAWPNDLVSGAKKLGGILTEMATNDLGERIAVVGVGINLNQKKLPLEIADFATSMALDRGGSYDARQMAEGILSRFPNLPEPSTWAELAPVWNLFDHTPGKRYQTPNGEEAIALGIGPEGQLMCAVNGETTSVMAADAVFGG